MIETVVRWWEKRQRVNASVEWPEYKARVVCAQAVAAMEGDGPGYWEGILTYSYTVPGHELEVGEFRKAFIDKWAVDMWADALNGSYVNVRVDPEDTKRSVWAEDWRQAG